ncbi:unnamed protein product [Gongylonema pulchrum]|uniref:MFAP1 domain-containing protein n=1 Tax=Gongylonema pulchrum TaxID=637853 RepID=A0A183DGA5_9BILA|nr:unnamed protein product [Gongylonema pulchrum]
MVSGPKKKLITGIENETLLRLEKSKIKVKMNLEKQRDNDEESTDEVQYKEPEIDELVEQRTRELEQYVKHKKDRAVLEAKTQLRAND